MENRNLATIHLEKPDELIFSPQLVSYAAEKLINTILLYEQHNPTDTNAERQIPIKDVRAIMGNSKSHNAAFLQRVVEELADVKLRWGELLGDPEDQPDRLNVVVPFLQKAAYRTRHDHTIDPERGYITYQLSDPIFGLIKRKSIARQNATNVQVMLQTAFICPYTKKFYEVFTHYLEKEPNAPFISVIFTNDNIRKLVGLEGSYPVYNDLNKYVVRPNIEELNKMADFTVTYKPLKNGKAIHALEFTATRKVEFQMQLNLPASEKLPRLLEQALQANRQNHEREPLIKRLTDYNIAQRFAHDTIDKLGIDRVQAIITAVDADLNKGYRPKSRTAYMKSCLTGQTIPGKYEERAGVPTQLIPLFDMMINEFDLAKTQAQQLCVEHPPEQIESAILLFRTERDRGKRLGKGYLISAIRNDYGKEMREAAASESLTASRNWKEQTEGVIANWKPKFQALPTEAQQGLVEQFISKPPTTWGKLAQNDYNAHGIDGTYAGREFFEWYARQAGHQQAQAK